MKKIMAFLLTAVLILSASSFVFAEHLTGADDWEVEYTSDKEVVSSFDGNEIADAVAGLMPGDDITLTIKVKNTSGKTVDWYMLNEIISSLEDSRESAAGGGYTYLLTYTGTDGEVNEIYSSSTVGGESADPAAPPDTDSPEGLHEVDSALKEYLYLERMETGKSGEVKLFVALDGESQGNGYMDTMADLRLRFAAEEVETKIVITGDNSKGVPSYVYIAMMVCGIIILILAIDGALRSGKKSKAKKKIACLILFAMLLGSFSNLAFADSLYKVRVYPGNDSVGVLTSGESVYEEQVVYGENFEFDFDLIEVKDDRYFVKGIRESGKDNSTYTKDAVKITKDCDYVIAYGLKSNMVSYTVNYYDAEGNELHESETFYGNVGDKPVVAFKYCEGFQPQAYKLTKTLTDDPDENVFTFEYTEVVPETVVIVIPGGPEGQPQGPGQQGGEDQQGGQEQQGGEDQQGGQQGGEDQQGGNTEPADIIDIDDETTPLTPDAPEPAKKSIPGWVWAAGGAAALGLVVVPIILIGKKKRDDDDDDDDEDE